MKELFSWIFDPYTQTSVPLSSSFGRHVLHKFVQAYMSNQHGGKPNRKKLHRRQKRLNKNTPDVRSVPSQWVMYVLEDCPFCQKATRILKAQSSRVKVITVLPKLKDTFKQLLHHPSFPIIYHKKQKIGGLDNLEVYLKTLSTDS